MVKLGPVYETASGTLVMQHHGGAVTTIDRSGHEITTPPRRPSDWRTADEIKRDRESVAAQRGEGGE